MYLWNGIKSSGKDKLLKQPLAEALYVVSLLKSVAEADISTFEKRLICQKSVFLAEKFGLIPAIYAFNVYIKGPYSPDLANDLFVLKSFFDKIGKLSIGVDEIKARFESFKSLLDEVERNPRKLEILSTYLFLCDRQSSESALKHLRELKKCGAGEEAEAKFLAGKYGLVKRL